MTSKEKTIKRMENLKVEIKKEKKEYDRISLWSKLQLEYYNQVLKDLEILEIIKKWSFLDTFYSEYTDTTYNRFLCNIHTKGMKEDFEKVKEWLENEK